MQYIIPWHTLRVLLTLCGKMAQEWNNKSVCRTLLPLDIDLYSILTHPITSFWRPLPIHLLRSVPSSFKCSRVKGITLKSTKSGMFECLFIQVKVEKLRMAFKKKIEQSFVNTDNWEQTILIDVTTVF